MAPATTYFTAVALSQLHLLISCWTSIYRNYALLRRDCFDATHVVAYCPVNAWITSLHRVMLRQIKTASLTYSLRVRAPLQHPSLKVNAVSLAERNVRVPSFRFARFSSLQVCLLDFIVISFDIKLSGTIFCDYQCRILFISRESMHSLGLNLLLASLAWRQPSWFWRGRNGFSIEKGGKFLHLKTNIGDIAVSPLKERGSLHF